jgi:hypothetical protein
MLVVTAVSCQVILWPSGGLAGLATWESISEPRGFLKILISAQSDDLVFTAFGFKGSVLMVVVQTAMIGHLPYTTLCAGIFAYPTVAEGLITPLSNVPVKAAKQSC